MKETQESQLAENSLLMKNNFDLFEPILALRGVLHQLSDKKELLPAHLLSVSRLARKAGRFQLAANAVYQLKQVSNLPPATTVAWRLEEAKILWYQNEREKAINCVKSLIKTMNTNNGK
jgi:hypothetical protein